MTQANKTLPVVGFCAACSGMGKTTLLTKLIPALRASGLRTSIIKHAHHQFDIDQPGKDSYRLREAGAIQTLVASNKRWALMTELPPAPNHSNTPDLHTLLLNLDVSLADLVLVEGFKHASIPKIEVYRPSMAAPLLAVNDPDIIAVASDVAVETNLPLLDLNNPPAIAEFIQRWLITQN
jgi:molybdopterin-guanine dinucleotide biosynthesis protein B